MFKDKKVIHLVARGLNGEIGANNKLLWNIPEDLRYFKESTIGHVVLMGRKTYESLPKQLEKRITLVVSREDYADEEKEFALTWGLDDSVVYSNNLNNNKFFIAGGGQLYKSTLDVVDELWITQVEGYYPEADTFYHIPNGFKLVDEIYGDDCESTDVGYSFQKWVKVVDTQN